MNSDGGMQKLHRLLQSSEPAASKEVCWNWKAAQLPIWAAIHNRQQEVCRVGFAGVRICLHGAQSSGAICTLWKL